MGGQREGQKEQTSPTKIISYQDTNVLLSPGGTLAALAARSSFSGSFAADGHRVPWGISAVLALEVALRRWGQQAHKVSLGWELPRAPAEFLSQTFVLLSTRSSFQELLEKTD